MGSKDDILKIAQAVAEKASRLIEKTLGYKLSVSYLTIFAHTTYEYERFVEWASELGERSEANNGMKFALKTPVSTAAGSVRLIRIRKPDPYRSQVGCADFLVEDYVSFKNAELPGHPDNLRLIERPEYEMLEFYDLEPNDVLAYVLSK